MIKRPEPGGRGAGQEGAEGGAGRAGASGEDAAEALEVQDLGEGLLLHDGGGEGGLLLLERADLPLDAVGGEEAVGDDGWK